MKTAWFGWLGVLTLAGCSFAAPSEDGQQSPPAPVGADGPSAELARMPMEARRERLRRFGETLRPRLSHTAHGLTPHRTSTGVVVTSLEGRFGHAVMARRGASGQVEYGCFDNANAAAHFIDHDAAGTP